MFGYALLLIINFHENLNYLPCSIVFGSMVVCITKNLCPEYLLSKTERPVKTGQTGLFSVLNLENLVRPMTGPQLRS